MTEKPDLTRWNRAGLSRFRYIDGNAATYLEALRLALLYRFIALDESQKERFSWWQYLWRSIPEEGSEWTALKDKLDAFKGALEWDDLWLDFRPGGETVTDHNNRMRQQYAGEQRRDYAWEIARSFARACHVLTEHVDAYANEGFLETATQWDDLRRLVGMLDYHPAPPASASVLLVLEAAEGESGRVEKGFQVQYTRPEGGEPIVFETLADVAIGASLNELRLLDWSYNASNFFPFDGQYGEDRPWALIPGLQPSVGDVGLLVQAPRKSSSERECACAVVIATVDEGEGHLAIEACQDPPQGLEWRKGDTRLLLSPKNVYKPRLNGTDVATLDRPHGLRPGETIAWQKSGGTWVFSDVLEADERAVRLAAELPTAGTALRRTEIMRPMSDGKVRISTTVDGAAHRNSAGQWAAFDMEDAFDLVTDGRAGLGSYRQLKDGYSEILIILGDVGEVVAPSQSETALAQTPPSPLSVIFDGSSGELRSGLWVVGEGFAEGFAEGGVPPPREALRIESVTAWEDGFKLELSTEGCPAGDGKARMAALRRRLQMLDVALDNAVFNTVTLRELIAGELAQRSASGISGIGAPTEDGSSYYDGLRAALNKEELSIADVAGINPEQEVPGIPHALRQELKTKAVLVTSFALGAHEVGDLLELSLADACTRLDQAMAEAGAFVAGSALVGNGGLRRLYGPFEHALRPQGYDRNETVATNSFPLDVDSDEGIPELLKPGRAVLIEQQENGRQIKSVKDLITTIHDNQITLERGLLEDDGFTYANTVIRGNVVLAGHGESLGEKLLGSGDATRANQSFVLEVADISFVADPAQPAGVRADIEVKVEGQIWQQVGSLKSSGPTDPQHTVRMTEEGFLRISFGDGINGRRLPTGVNNVRAAYRVGTGLSGNLSAGSLDEPVNPHPFVESVRQPNDAIGGADREGLDSLREHAPASLLALERAVSLRDFADLAVSQANIWQARAFRGTTVLGRHESIYVVIVPAGGIDPSKAEDVLPDEFINAQGDFLTAHALPGVSVTVSCYTPVIFKLDITVRVKTAEYDPYEVRNAARASLFEAFSLERRKLGQSLYLSDVYQVVESVPGVENSECKITGIVEPRESDQAARFIRAAPGEVVHLHPRLSSLSITHEAYAL